MNHSKTPLPYHSERFQDPVSGQMVWELTYNKSEPPQSIRIPLDEALAILIEGIVEEAEAFPTVLRRHHAYPRLLAAVDKVRAMPISA